MKDAVNRGELPKGRYERYIRIIETIDEERRKSGGKDCTFNPVS